MPARHEDIAIDSSFWRGKRVFLTGHTGFKGTWLTVWLHAMGATVRGLALAPNTTPSIFEALDAASLCQHELGDVRNFDEINQQVTKFRPDIAFHLAAQPLVRDSYRQPMETFATNAQGTVHFLEACRQNTTRAVLVITTDKVYENREWAFSYRETDPLGGFDPYSASKACAEIATASYRTAFFPPDRHAAHGVALASARAGNVFGGGDWSADRLIPDAVRAFVDGKPLTIRNPEAVRPWQHVLEPLSGYLMLARSLYESGPKHARAWNFGPDSSQLVTVAALADEFARAWGNGAACTHVPDPNAVHEANSLLLDSGLANRVLGWRPRMPLTTAMAATADWYKSFYGGARAAELRSLTLAQIDGLARNAAPAGQ